MEENLMQIEKMFNEMFDFESMKKDTESRIKNAIQKIKKNDNYIAKYWGTRITFEESKKIHVIFEIYENEDEMLADYIIKCIYNENGEFEQIYYKK